MPHGDHDDFIDEQADDDRRCAQQHVVDEAHHGAEPRPAPVFREVGSRQHADGRADQDAEHGHDGAAVQGIEQTALAAGRRGHFGEQMPRHAGQSMRQQGPQDRRQAGQARQGGHRGQREESAVFRLAQRPPVHAADPPRRSNRRSMACAAAITVKVIKNNSSPRAISEEVYRSPTASVNSLAMAEEIVVPGARMEALMRCALPITKVTAMVSPSALPKPSMTPPTMPTRERGTTTFHITSQVVAPSAYPDSLSMGGTVSNTSRM